MKEKSEIRHMVDGWSGPSIGRIPPLPQRMPAWYWFKKKELRSPPPFFEKKYLYDNYEIRQAYKNGFSHTL